MEFSAIEEIKNDIKLVKRNIDVINVWIEDGVSKEYIEARKKDMEFHNGLLVAYETALKYAEKEFNQKRGL